MIKVIFMKRRDFIILSASLFSFSKSVFASAPTLTVYKSPTCSCCDDWIGHLKQAGFFVTAENVSDQNLSDLKLRSGISPNLRSCHTGFINNYFIEGHVPADDIKLLLLKKPVGLGLAVPGMPAGSPGMEMGNRRDPYDTLFVRGDGSTIVFRSHRYIKV